MELHAVRTYGYSGPNPLSFVDLHAYQAVTGIALPSWTVDLVQFLDKVFLNRVYSKREGT